MGKRRERSTAMGPFTVCAEVDPPHPSDPCARWLQRREHASGNEQ